jgi:hypothetical protein
MTIGGWTLTTCRMWQSNSSLIHGDEEEEEEGRKEGVVDCCIGEMCRRSIWLELLWRLDNHAPFRVRFLILS